MKNHIYFSVNYNITMFRNELPFKRIDKTKSTLVTLIKRLSTGITAINVIYYPSPFKLNSLENKKKIFFPWRKRLSRLECYLHLQHQTVESSYRTIWKFDSWWLIGVRKKRANRLMACYELICTALILFLKIITKIANYRDKFVSISYLILFL